MGARYQLLLVRPATAAQSRAVAEAFGVDAAAGRFARVRDDDFAEYPRDAADLGTRAASRDYGEAIYLGSYDGPAGELCGSFLYERSVGGALQRALVLGSSAWGWPPHPVWGEHAYWFRVDGTPEPFEADVLRWDGEAHEREGAALEELRGDFELEESAVAGEREALERMFRLGRLEAGTALPRRDASDLPVHVGLLGAVPRHFGFTLRRA